MQPHGSFFSTCFYRQYFLASIEQSSSLVPCLPLLLLCTIISFCRSLVRRSATSAPIIFSCSSHLLFLSCDRTIQILPLVFCQNSSLNLSLTIPSRLLA